MDVQKDYTDYMSENIRYLRRLVRMSQEDFAAYLGYRSFTTVQKWESGQSDPPVETMLNICDLFRITLDELTGVDLEAADEERGGRDLTITKWMLRARKSVKESKPQDAGGLNLKNASSIEISRNEKLAQPPKSGISPDISPDDPDNLRLPIPQIGTLIGQAAKDPDAVKAIETFMQLSPEDRQLALGMLRGLTGNHSQ